MNIITLGIAGGLLALLVFVHFVVDWVFQTHAEAMVKHNDARVRARHCLIYMSGFIPLLILMHFSLLRFFVAMNILFWSHFAEDTYIPVFLWTKYIRRPPSMTPSFTNDFSEKKGFGQFIDTTLGKILMITIDQIIHIVFLIPIVVLALWK